MEPLASSEQQPQDRGRNQKNNSNNIANPYQREQWTTAHETNEQTYTRTPRNDANIIKTEQTRQESHSNHKQHNNTHDITKEGQATATTQRRQERRKNMRVCNTYCRSKQSEPFVCAGGRKTVVDTVLSAPSGTRILHLLACQR